ncbi:hypothetical protein UlMin_014575 [Ulmus minor]
MSTKLIYSLTDENPDLKKQIGCMNGIFQLFDRHRFVAAGRVNGHSHKRLPPSGQNGNQAVEPNGKLQNLTEKNKKKIVKEKGRISTESSRTSLSSSSPSSSFSSLDYKAAHQEPSPSSQTFSVGTPIRELHVNPQNALIRLTQKSANLRDVVKDSMHREARGLSVRTAAKDETVVHTLKYIDSPRPSLPSKSVKPRNSGLNDSFRAFAKPREAPLSSNEGKDGCAVWVPKDIRRLSYDGRESRDTLKSTMKLKELPRLSLDSRAGSMRGNHGETSNLQHEPGSGKRPSNVVAQLMGLEAFSDPIPIIDDQLRVASSCQTERHDPFSRSSRMTNGNKSDHFSWSPKNSPKDLSSQQAKNAVLFTKNTASQKIPIETAPWRQPQGSRGSQSPALKSQEAPTKTLTLSPSVYGEIEKRLANLEFKKSGKDLRALKQILEAMQKTKEILDNKRDQTSKFTSPVSDNSSLDRSSNSRSQQSNIPMSSTVKESKSPKSYKSPIVIMKPAKLLEKSNSPRSSVSSIDNLSSHHTLQTSGSADNRKASIDKRTATQLTPRNTHSSSKNKNTNLRPSKSAQASKMPQRNGDENSASPGRSTGSVSPRPQQRRLGMDKQSSRSSSLDSSRTRRQSNRQATESSSPGRKWMPKCSNSQQTTNQLSEENRELSHQSDSISLQSESSISLASRMDNEVTSNIQPEKINDNYFKQNPSARFSADGAMAEPGRLTAEQPSPISVLDATFYRDESPSPVKKTSNAYALKDYETLYPDDEVEWMEVDQDQISHSRKSSLSSEIDHTILENIQTSVRNPTESNCADMEPIIGNTDFLCDNRNPDHLYISDILSASGLLRKVDSGLIQSHSSDHLINPKLFFALEKDKASTRILFNEYGSEKTIQQRPEQKIQRTLLFDVVNEILLRKLVVADSFKQRFSLDKQTGKKQRGQRLLRELCSEVDRLQGNNNSGGSLDEDDDCLRSILCEDMMQWPMNCTEYNREIPGLVLDVERLIFKDLITELVTGEIAGQQRRLAHCRQLFPK